MKQPEQPQEDRLKTYFSCIRSNLEKTTEEVKNLSTKKELTQLEINRLARTTWNLTQVHKYLKKHFRGFF